MSGEWCLIESDPGILTELCGRIGVEGVQCEELWTPDAASIEQLHPVYGLIFLFKYGGEKEKKEPIKHEVPDLYFAQQLITNACATVALVNILMNAEGVELGPELNDFKGFTSGLPADMKGLAISNSDTIRTVHNSFARQEIFSVVDPDHKGTEDAFHFLAFVPHRGRLYELDGLNSAPVDHGAIDGNWYAAASQALTERIAAFGSDEIRFNLCAIVKDRKKVYSELLERLQAGDADLAAMHTEEELKGLIAQEDAKRVSRGKESLRRKHNYIPVFLEAARQLARRGKLMPILTAAKAKQRIKYEEAMAKQKAEGAAAEGAA
mmetsp:Transcript_32649/g.85483  ORF Transcript_32649/g.85483 Transcript_32649/m.85483 type:complete len:322 (-) Transcript_32649:89-1054(-)|eukprot:CAMPEP_0182926458 /NCGR_PEP_ID=MMETSP0105_2-20130417/12092_1 /TAXON_ID=81532 ORGANISM="Acanthoeca-like sp., Strain 10tr" /NCGR_SAMPLE_ID=MMETSP0105_2 /ASSEMBLY_ACC=CAM_ASM_000205 /LENGTH=321 /DNA_ID=CAMNT_0025064355 /DNA_START=159 /DNA_END=1124 /DNA_ORIENTATION=+